MIAFRLRAQHLAERSDEHGLLDAAGRCGVQNTAGQPLGEAVVHFCIRILTDDLKALQSPPTPKGARLLPPRDPYTQLRDRDTIVDKKYHRDVWKPVGDPTVDSETLLDATDRLHAEFWQPTGRLHPDLNLDHNEAILPADHGGRVGTSTKWWT